MKIPNYDNYIIYNNGDVFSIKKNIFLKTRTNYDGYKRVDLSDNNKKKKTFFIHQLVAIAYLNHTLDNYDKCIDHIDNDKTNNVYNNLQIISRSQNSRKGASTLEQKLKQGTYKTQNGTYIAMIQFNNIKQYLGTFKTFEEAKSSYDKIYATLMMGVKN